jgi:hypothetical protein
LNQEDGLFTTIKLPSCIQKTPEIWACFNGKYCQVLDGKNSYLFELIDSSKFEKINEEASVLAGSMTYNYKTNMITKYGTPVRQMYAHPLLMAKI